MKKKFFVSLLLAALLISCFGLSAGAAGLDYVTDNANLLTPAERQTLNDNAAQISQHYGCGVYVITVDDYKNYVNGDMQAFTETVYKSYELGEGSDKSGIVLALSMAERDYDLCAYGDFGNYAFTDYGKDKLAETFLDNFRNNDWAGGFNDYVGNCGSLLELAKNGEPLDTIVYDEEPETPGLDFFDIVIILLVSCAAAGIVCGIFAMQMKTAVSQSGAADYVQAGGANLSLKEDRFLHRQVTRRIIKRDDDDRDSGGRPGGTTVNAGGFSHKGGKF